MRNLLCMITLLYAITVNSQNYGIITEKSPSRSQYFSWINNTNEGATEKQTMVNLDFFNWLYTHYGMKLDIYAFDAGVIDGKNFYGSMDSDNFKRKFPDSFRNVYSKARLMDTRLGVWGGPDGFGDTDEDALKRKNIMVSLCHDYNWALFKFDAVCGPLRLDKENQFISMMEECRKYSPDLILLNHRLGLEKAKPYATTFLWEGQETYIDVHMGNTFTAPYNRACALTRGVVPGLKRLTEDHGVCLSSCLDYWEDDLVLQAFNRSLILSPEIYGNPWLLADSDFPKMARLFNLHKRLSKILVNGIILPASYGQYAVSRGDNKNRIITLRNISWYDKTYRISLGKEIGLKKGSKVIVRQYHPSERIIGTFRYGDEVTVTVPAFRSMLLFVSSDNKYKDVAVEGADFEVVRDVPGSPLEIKLLGYPGENYSVRLSGVSSAKSVTIDGKVCPGLLKKGNKVDIAFDGKRCSDHVLNRKITEMSVSDKEVDTDALYEATVFSADNNALEVRCLQRSGKTKIPQVKKARDMFFNQSTFVERGTWDRYLFDGDMSTGFWPSKRYGIDQTVNKGCFRMDLGQDMHVDSIVLRTSSFFELEPLLKEEGNFAYVSSDVSTWKKIVYEANLNSVIQIGGNMRYIKLPNYPSCMKEVEVYAKGKRVDSNLFRASNLFADSKRMKCQKLWRSSFTLDDIHTGAYLSVAINGRHGKEGAYAALMVDGEMVGAPSRAVSYPSNTWEYVNIKSDSNYTYYIPLDKTMKGKKMEVFVMAYDKENMNIKPEIWLSESPYSRPCKTIVVNR